MAVSGGAVFPGALGLVVRSPLVPYRGLGVVSLKSKMLAMLWAVSRVWGWPFPRISLDRLVRIITLVWKVLAMLLTVSRVLASSFPRAFSKPSSARWCHARAFW